jgi:hypothetical protein
MYLRAELMEVASRGQLEFDRGEPGRSQGPSRQGQSGDPQTARCVFDRISVATKDQD